MKKLFEAVKAWLRSRVTAIVWVKGDGLKVKGDEGKVKGNKTSEAFPLRGNKKGGALTLPEVQAVLCHKYELRYNLLSEQSEYYTDNFDLTAENQCERKLLDCLLINLDEFDRYSSRKQSTLKNLM